MMQEKLLTMEQVENLFAELEGIKKVGGINSRACRGEAELLVDAVSAMILAAEAVGGDACKDVIVKGWAYVRQVNNEIEKYNSTKLVLHCDICHSSFLGGGKNGDQAIEDAKESLASHVAKFHPRSVASA